MSEIKELNIKEVKLATKMAIAGKDTVAIALISLGMKFISEGDYITGGALVTIGWILLVIQGIIK